MAVLCFLKVITTMMVSIWNDDDDDDHEDPTKSDIFVCDELNFVHDHHRQRVKDENLAYRDLSIAKEENYNIDDREHTNKNHFLSKNSNNWIPQMLPEDILPFR